MRTVIHVLSFIATVLAVALLSLATPLAGNALASTTHPVPITTITPLQSHGIYTTPAYDLQGNAHCPRGTELFDTGNPALGDAGVVCTALYVEV